VNGRGDILLSTGERIIDGYYRYHYWWSEVNPSSAHQERITEDIRTQVVEALADAIASRS
jgi:hypothetical protein